MQKVSRVKATTDLQASISEALDKIGGLNSFISKSDTVLLKPNFNTADPFPASSDIEFLRAVIQLFSEISPKRLILGDSCTFSQNTETVMDNLCVPDLQKEFPNLETINFDKHKWVKKKVPGGKYLKTVSTPEILDQVDKLVLLPCLKTHMFAQFTGSLKLSIGLMKPSERLLLHANRLQEKIAELNLVIHPDLIIMDGRKCFINKGPSSGDIAKPSLILASTNRISIDLEGINIIQEYDSNSLENIPPEELIQIAHAIKIGVN